MIYIILSGLSIIMLSLIISIGKSAIKNILQTARAILYIILAIIIIGLVYNPKGTLNSIAKIFWFTIGIIKLIISLF